MTKQMQIFDVIFDLNFTNNEYTKFCNNCDIDFDFNQIFLKREVTCINACEMKN